MGTPGKRFREFFDTIQKGFKGVGQVMPLDSICLNRNLRREKVMVQASLV